MGSSGTAPYHFLAKTINRENGIQFGRRVVFDHSRYDNYLAQIMEQRGEKWKEQDEEKQRLAKEGVEEV